jgi:hypothetical protein
VTTPPTFLVRGARALALLSEAPQTVRAVRELVVCVQHLNTSLAVTRASLSRSAQAPVACEPRRINRQAGDGKLLARPAANRRHSDGGRQRLRSDISSNSLRIRISNGARTRLTTVVVIGYSEH